jgi:hypothetical protein
VNLNRSLLLLVVSIVCFAIGLIIAVGWINGGNLNAWLFGGLLAFAAAHLP